MQVNLCIGSVISWEIFVKDRTFHHTCIWYFRSGWSRWNFDKIFDVRKTTISGIRDSEKVLSCVCSTISTEKFMTSLQNLFKFLWYIFSSFCQFVVVSGQLSTLFLGILWNTLTFYIISYVAYTMFCVMFISDWSDFTSCLSTNDVTFDDMYKYLSTYQFHDYYYNATVASYYFFCTHIERKSARQLISICIMLFVRRLKAGWFDLGKWIALLYATVGPAFSVNWKQEIT